MKIYEILCLALIVFIIIEYIRLYFSNKEEKKFCDDLSEQLEKLTKMLDEVVNHNGQLVNEWVDCHKRNVILTRELNFYKYPEKGQEIKTNG